MDYQELEPKKSKQGHDAFAGKRPKRDNSTFVLILLVLGMVAIIIVSAALNLVDLKNPFAVTGGSVLKEGTKTTQTKGGEVKTIKNIQLSAEVYGESFEVPAEGLDVTIVANEVQIISSTMDIIVSLDKPMVMEGFTGRMYWKDTMFILEGKLGNYLSEELKINWKAEENIKIRVLSGSIETAQVSIPLFETVATGKIELSDKVSLTPKKDLLKLDHYRGSFKASVDESQALVTLKGSVEDITLGNEQLSFNVG